jgi:hypothetical protein
MDNGNGLREGSPPRGFVDGPAARDHVAVALRQREAGMLIIVIFGLDIALTFLAANIVGPAAFRFEHYGLPGLLFKAPFYLLRLYIGAAALLL